MRLSILVACSVVAVGVLVFHSSFGIFLPAPINTFDPITDIVLRKGILIAKKKIIIGKKFIAAGVILLLVIRGLYRGKRDLSLFSRSDMEQQSIVENRMHDQYDWAFRQISSLDRLSCLPRMVCELYALPRPMKPRGLRKQMLDFFDKMSQTKMNPHVSWFPFNLAVMIGKNSKSLDICQRTYVTCPWNSTLTYNALTTLGTVMKKHPHRIFNF